jgi:hypothetical protein
LSNRLVVFPLFVLFSLSLSSAGQQFPDTSFRQKSLSNLIQFYYSAIGLQAHLYNGPLYEPYPRPFTDGHQFFKTDAFSNETVSYDGLQYFNIPLRYDIIRDEVVTLYPVNNFYVSLIREKLDSFTFLNHSFIKINSDSVSAPSTGFYDQLFFSPAISFLAARKKNMLEVSERLSVDVKVTERTNYYIKKDNVYHTVKNKKSVMGLLKDKKTEMQQYIKDNKLRFKNFEADVIQTLRYYNQLM